MALPVHPGPLLKARARRLQAGWVLGGVGAWGLVWLVLGLRRLAKFYEQPLNAGALGTRWVAERSRRTLGGVAADPP